MAETETFVFRASLRPTIYRAFEISAAISLYTLAPAIMRFFDLDLDHAFGFSSRPRKAFAILLRCRLRHQPGRAAGRGTGWPSRRRRRRGTGSAPETACPRAGSP